MPVMDRYQQFNSQALFPDYQRQWSELQKETSPPPAHLRHSSPRRDDASTPPLFPLIYILA